MFEKILCANDGSERAFHALALAITIAKENDSELHMVSIEEIDYMPEFIEEVREEIGTAARQFHTVLQRARAMAEKDHVKLHTHVLAGHPVRDIVDACGRSEGRPARYRLGGPFRDLRTDARQPRRPARSFGRLSGSGRQVVEL